MAVAALKKSDGSGRFDDIPVEGSASEASGSRKKLERASPKKMALEKTVPGELPPRFSLESLRSLELKPSRPWLIKDFLPSSGIHVIYGAPGAGKSFVALHAGLHVAAGRTWGARKVSPTGVVYIASEGAAGFRRRVIAARDHLKIPDDAPFALVTVAPNLGRNSTDVNELVSSIRAQTVGWKYQPGLIFLDTLTLSMPGLDESRSEDMMIFVNNAKRLAEELEATVVPIHHTGKDEERGMRGSSALHGAADGEWLISRDPETDQRQIVLQKMRDGKDKSRLDFDLQPYKFVERDADDDEITTLVAAVRSDAKPPLVALLRHQQEVLQALKVLLQTEGVQQTGASAAPKGAKTLDYARLRKVLTDSSLLTGVTKESLSSIIPKDMKRLHELGLIGRKENTLWLIEDLSARTPPDDPARMTDGG